MKCHGLATAMLGVVLVTCAGNRTPTEGDADARIVARAVALPAVASSGDAFDVELTATNVTSAPIELTTTSGCALAYEVVGPGGVVVAAPIHPCTAVIRSIRLAAGEVLRETYRYETGDVLFPRLAPGAYRIVPTMNLRSIPGLVVQGTDMQVR
jgi:hypothetical protein